MAKRQVKRTATFKTDFKEAGINCKKHFMALMTRYGVRGYKCGVKIFGEDFDFYFKDRQIGVRVGELSEVIELDNRLVINVGDEIDSDWFEAIAMVTGQAPEDMRPVYPWILKEMSEPFERSRV